MGGYPTICHIDVCDITASLLSEVCSNVTVKPSLQPLTGEQLQMRSASSDPSAHLDLPVVRVGHFEKTFFDVLVFNPFAKSNAETSLPGMNHRHMRKRKRGNMSNASMRLNMPLFPCWCLPQPVVWPNSLFRYIKY